MQSWIAFVSRMFKVATWKSHLWSLLWKAQLPREGHEQDVVAGSSLDHGRDTNCVNTPVLETRLDSTSRSDDLGFELEPALSLISSNEKLRLEFDSDSLKVSTIEVHNRYNEESCTQVLVSTIHLNQDVCIQIARAIETSRTLIVISLQMYNFPEEVGIAHLAFQEFGNAIRSNQNIEEVRIFIDKCVSLDEIVMKCSLILLEGLKLESLTLGSGVGLPLGRNTIETFACGLRRTLTLRGFSIFTSHPSGWIDIEGLKLLLEPFMGGEESNQSVQGLGLNCAGIDDEGARVVASMLRHNTGPLQGLSLHGNKIGPKGATDIAAALRSNTSLQTLYISHNPIGAGGLEAIAALLTNNVAEGNLETCNSSLRCLNLRYEIGQEGIEHLETLVRGNTSLVSLDLGKCSLLETTENVIRLLEALKSNKSLKAVDVTYCLGVVGRRVLGTIFDLLQVNHSLVHLDLGGTPLEADGGAQMVSALLERKAKNKMWEVLEGMATVRPNSARIFLCGYPFAGKLMSELIPNQIQILLIMYVRLIYVRVILYLTQHDFQWCELVVLLTTSFLQVW